MIISLSAMLNKHGESTLYFDVKNKVLNIISKNPKIVISAITSKLHLSEIYVSKII